MRIITAVYEVFVKDLKELKCSEEFRELRFFGRNELSDLTIAETHQDILLFYIKHFNDGFGLGMELAFKNRVILIGATGFEPATSRPPAVRATKLRHTP